MKLGTLKRSTNAVGSDAPRKPNPVTQREIILEQSKTLRALAKALAVQRSSALVLGESMTAAELTESLSRITRWLEEGATSLDDLADKAKYAAGIPAWRFIVQIAGGFLLGLIALIALVWALDASLPVSQPSIGHDDTREWIAVPTDHTTPR